MIIKELTQIESQAAYESFIQTKLVPESELDQDYLALRTDIKSKFDELISAGYKLYQLDYRFSLWFYDYMESKDWFGDRVASNYLFWNYLALKVMPDIIYTRWGEDKAQEHYFAKGLRVYPYTLYWYTNLSWQGNISLTEKVLSTPGHFSTNSILHLVERPGRYYGTFVDLYRMIMKQYANIVPSKGKYIDYKRLFESVMKLCMAKTLVIDPYLCEGGPEQFAKDLIKECVEEIDFMDDIDKVEPLFVPETVTETPEDLQGTTKLRLDGAGPYSKCEFVYQVVKKFVSVEPTVTFAELSATFKTSFLERWSTFRFLEPDIKRAKQWREDGESHKHYFIEDDQVLTSGDDICFVVCVEWDKNNIINILGLVKALGWNYSIERN